MSAAPSASHLLRLSTELQQEITELLPKRALKDIRLVCIELSASADRAFIERFFVHRRHVITDQSLRVLANIMQTRLGAKMDKLDLTIATLSQSDMIRGSKSRHVYDLWKSWLHMEYTTRNSLPRHLMQAFAPMVKRGRPLALGLVDWRLDTGAHGEHVLLDAFGAKDKGFSRASNEHTVRAVLGAVVEAALSLSSLKIDTNNTMDDRSFLFDVTTNSFRPLFDSGLASLSSLSLWSIEDFGRHKHLWRDLFAQATGLKSLELGYASTNKLWHPDSQWFEQASYVFKPHTLEHIGVLGWALYGLDSLAPVHRFLSYHRDSLRSVRLDSDQDRSHEQWPRNVKFAAEQLSLESLELRSDVHRLDEHRVYLTAHLKLRSAAEIKTHALRLKDVDREV